MGRFVEDMLRAKYGRMQDGRGRNDYGYDMRNRDMRGRDMGNDYMQQDYANRDMRSNDYGNMGGREEYYQQDGHYPYGRGMPHYPPYDYGYNEDYGRRGSGRRDYGEEEIHYGKLSKKDMEEWGKMLENSDGSRGEHFKKEQVEQLARQIGFDMHQLGGVDIFAMTVNMMYADYCSVAKKYGIDRPEFYMDMAKGFLNDKDFKGNPEEKLWLYYYCIVKK